MMAASGAVPTTSLLSIHHHHHQQHTQRPYQYSPSSPPPQYPPHSSLYYPVGATSAAQISSHQYPLSETAHRADDPSSSSSSSSSSSQQQQRPMEAASLSSSSASKASKASTSLSAAKAKSSAVKRANAKAAAATKKAQASASASAQAAAALPSSGDDDDDDDDQVVADTKGKAKARAGFASSSTPDSQPGDWVVPQRAKPGRKPSQEEPLTKRQAQNRASQRAFRERKQSHVATLEAKVAAFEAEKLTRDAREQENHKHLVEENESLQRDNAALRSKVQELEAALEQMRTGASAQSHRPSVADTAPSSSHWEPCNDAGGPVPMQKRDLAQPPVAQRRKRLFPSRAYEQADEDAIDGPSTAAPGFGTTSPADHFSYSSERQHHESLHAISAPAFEAAISKASSSSNERGDASLSHGDDAGSTSFVYPSLGPKLQSGLPTSPDFLPVDGDVEMLDRDCGFCTDATPCLCRGDAILDLTGMADGDDGDRAPTAATGVTSGVDRMAKIEENTEEEEKQEQLNDTPHAAIAIPSLLSARPRSSTKAKLWSVVSEAKIPSATASTKSKLWWTRPASAQTYWTPSATSFVAPGEKRADEQVYADARKRRNSLVASGATQADIEAALCSGDPSNCAACAADPALAAFCEAVGEDEEGVSAASALGAASAVGPSVSLPKRSNNKNGETEVGVPSAGNGISRPSLYSYSIPLSTSYRPRSTSTSTVPTLRSLDLDLGKGALRGQGSSIPDAFRQLRSHPGFPKWQGGLNLLADVVSGRGTTGQTRVASRISESTDRRVMMDEESDDHGDEGDDHSSHSATLRAAGSSHVKRRRLYVENDRVQEALRMLEVGSSGAAKTTPSYGARR